MNIKTFDDGEQFPKQFLFNGKPYKGEATFINGYNGYESTEGDGMMCAIIDFSCLDKTKYPKIVHHYLTDMDGNYIQSKNRRGVRMDITFKRYNIMYNVGKAKYLVNYHNGISKHNDGSDFFDIATFTNKEKFNIFITSLQTKGFIESNII
jgi:hypothetical protein